MTSDVADTLSAYLRDLEAQVAQLSALAESACAQREASRLCDVAAMDAIGANRERVVASLLDLERRQEPRRAALAADLAVAGTLDGFERVRALHRDAHRLLGEIDLADRETRSLLEQDDGTRRDAVHTLDTGEATLAAYRKTLSPTDTRSALLDSRG